MRPNVRRDVKFKQRQQRRRQRGKKIIIKRTVEDFVLQGAPFQWMNVRRIVVIRTYFRLSFFMDKGIEWMAYKRTIAHSVWFNWMTYREPRRKEIRFWFRFISQGGVCVLTNFVLLSRWTISWWRTRLFSPCPSAHLWNFSLSFLFLFCLVQLNEINADIFFFSWFGNICSCCLTGRKKKIRRVPTTEYIVANREHLLILTHIQHHNEIESGGNHVYAFSSMRSWTMMINE